MIQTMDKNTVLLEWNALEYQQKKKKPDWFWALGIIAVAGSAAAFIYGNFLFGIFIVLAAVAMMFFGNATPKRIRYVLSSEGVIADSRLYPYERLISFWMEEVEGEKRLLLKSDRTFLPILVLPFEEDDTGDAILDILSEILDQEELHESFAHKIMDRLGF